MVRILDISPESLRILASTIFVIAFVVFIWAITRYRKSKKSNDTSGKSLGKIKSKKLSDRDFFLDKLNTHQDQSIDALKIMTATFFDNYSISVTGKFSAADGVAGKDQKVPQAVFNGFVGKEHCTFHKLLEVWVFVPKEY